MRDLIRKIPFQFRSKPKIEAILKAIEEELNELDEARSQLETLLYIETAEGINLDRIGEIVVLSRADAGLLAAQAGNLDFNVIDDARYRKYLKYKILANTSNATYKDIITAVKMIWGVDKVSYNENLDGPASLTVSFPYHYTDEDIFILPPLTAAGVGINVRAETAIRSECTPAAGNRLFKRCFAGKNWGKECSRSGLSCRHEAGSLIGCKHCLYSSRKE